MNKDFNLGRLYERREVFVFLAQILNEPSDARRDEMLRQWLADAADTINVPSRRVLITEDVLVVL